MEWMNISYLLAFSSVFVASVSQILLKQSAQMEHKNVILVFAYRGVELKVTPMIESTGIIWVTILAVCFLKEKPTRRAVLSILITIFGIIVFSL